MSEPPNGRVPDGDVGGQLATEMVKQLVLLNQNMERQNILNAELQETLDELSGYHEVYGRTMEILHEQRGKPKLGLSDLAQAYIEAADEIMPAEDEPGEEDPAVEAGR